MNTLILYYSYGGNTKRIAEMIQKKIGGDLAEIETVKPYSGDYHSVVEPGAAGGKPGIYAGNKAFAGRYTSL